MSVDSGRVIASRHTRTPRQKAQLIYIACRGHSGSTLLELLLGGHSQLVAAGELEKISLQLARDTFPYPGLCSCGRRPFDCDRWRAVIDAVRQHRGIDMVKHPFRFRVSDVGREEDYGRRALSHWALHVSTRAARHAGYTPAGQLIGFPHCLWFCKRWVRNRLFIADVLRDVTSATGVIDNSKDVLGMRDLATHAPEDLKIIFLTRDPRACVYSTLRREKLGVEAGAEDWVHVNRSIIGLLAGVPRQNWTHVQYEDLCRDPGGTCQRLCEFIGYEYEPGMLDLSRGNQHTIGGNRIRFLPLGRVAEDRAWKDHLSAADLLNVRRIVEPTARALDYDVFQPS